MKITKKKLSDLRHPEKNTRMHTDKQLKEFRRSIEMFDQIRPIVIDENNVMLCGNGLYDALVSMGRTEADCYVLTGLSEKEKKKLMLADNRIYSLGVDDMDTFDAFVQELRDDLDIPGFDEEMLQSLVLDVGEVDELLTGYGIVPEDKIQQIKSTGEKYEAEGEAAAQDATEYLPQAAVEEAREVTGYAEPYKAEQSERRFIICPKCGERIWL